MKVLTPLSNLENIEMLSNSGADEFYFGFSTEAFTKKFGEYAEINKMSSFKNANFNEIDEALAVVQKVKSLSKEVFITLNSVSYSEEQIELIGDEIKPFVGKIDGVIASDLHLIDKLSKLGLQVVLSTIAGVYNKQTIAFYERFDNVKRIILPRDLSLDMIEELTKNKRFEYEAFLMNNGCRFSDSHCLGFHSRKFGSICGYLNNSNTIVDFSKLKNISFDDINSFDDNHLSYNKLHNEACGLCAIYRLLNFGITAVKVVGRANNLASISNSVRLTKENIKIAEKSSSEKQYLKEMLMPEDRHTRCVNGLNCYYAEVRFNGKHSD